MHAAEFAVTVVHGWLEFVAISAAGMATWGVDFGYGRLMMTGLFGTMAAQVVRALPLRFGLHTIMLMFVLLGLVYYTFRLPFSTASCVTFGGFTLFLFVEEVVCLYILRGLGIHIEDMLANLPMRFVFGFISPSVLGLYTVLVLWIRRVRRGRSGKEVHPTA